MGDEPRVPCPYCKESIAPGAKKCRWCGEILDETLRQQQRAASGDIGQDAAMRAVLPVGRTGLAIAAGYLGLFSCLGIFAPISLIVSILAIRELRADPTKHGMGRAIFGLVMGILGTLFFGFAILNAALGHH